MPEELGESTVTYKWYDFIPVIGWSTYKERNRKLYRDRMGRFERIEPPIIRRNTPLDIALFVYHGSVVWGGIVTATLYLTK